MWSMKKRLSVLFTVKSQSHCQAPEGPSKLVMDRTNREVPMAFPRGVAGLTEGRISPLDLQTQGWPVALRPEDPGGGQGGMLPLMLQWGQKAEGGLWRR